MGTSLNEIELINKHLLQVNIAEDALLFEAMLIIDPTLSEKVNYQKTAHTIVKQYGRQRLKAEIDLVHRQLFSEPGYKKFRERVMRLFVND